MSEQFMIGWGEADITPSNPKVELAGQYYQRVATGIHSRIKCVALAMKKGDQQSVEVTLDVVSMPPSLQKDIAEAAAAANPGLRAESIFLSAIHTHNAPYTNAKALFREWCPLDPDGLTPEEYNPFLVKTVGDAIRQAWQGLQPAGVAHGFGIARIGHCRRPAFATGVAQMYGDATRADFVGLEAGEDSGVELLFTFDKSGKPTGAIVNIPCPSQVMEATYKISSDYMGAGRELLKAKFGADFHTLCQVSAAGCQSPRDLVRHFTTEPDFWHEDGVPIHAKRMFDATMMGYESHSEIDYDPIFKHTVDTVSLPKRRASYTAYRQAKQELEELFKKKTEREAFQEFVDTIHANEKIPGRPGPYDDKEQDFVQMQNRKAVIHRYETQDAEPNFTFDLHTVRVGDCAISTNPFELYLHYGQIIKARSHAFQTFLVQLCPGGGGYLPSPEAERLGGYGGMIVNGYCGSDGGYKLADTAVEKINDLFD